VREMSLANWLSFPLHRGCYPEFMKKQPTALVFGSSGSIGGACVDLLSNDYQTFKGSRTFEDLNLGAPYDAVVWAQGINQTKHFMESSESDWESILDANLHFVRRSIVRLIENNLIMNPASFVFVGSVWSRLTRYEKSAYIVSKAALEGLAIGLAADLAQFGIRVNCVMPGVVDNLMTRENLTADQLSKIQTETLGGELISTRDVANVVRFLCSSDSSGVNGHSIVIDKGWSIARYI
jgi:3-oxoacyl-[acyl-carrier protein] reductase